MILFKVKVIINFVDTKFIYQGFYDIFVQVKWWNNQNNLTSPKFTGQIYISVHFINFFLAERKFLKFFDNLALSCRCIFINRFDNKIKESYITICNDVLFIIIQMTLYEIKRGSSYSIIIFERFTGLEMFTELLGFFDELIV